MLVLSRLRGETVIIGDDIARITVTAIHDHAVKLRIASQLGAETRWVRVEQTFWINRDLGVTYNSRRSDKARLGIHAPRAISVHREEVFERIAAEGGVPCL